jgi:hypothetical protein
MDNPKGKDVCQQVKGGIGCGYWLIGLSMTLEVWRSSHTTISGFMAQHFDGHMTKSGIESPP